MYQDYKAKATRITAAEWNGNRLHEGITEGADGYEWHGIPCGTGETAFLVKDEFGFREVYTASAFARYYESAY